MRTPVGLKLQNYRMPCRHSGQAIVLILLLTLAGLVGGVALYSTGILTSEKMQLQNAADATAYSVSVVEARDLNFTAYMNRGMVGNEVAIGQMVSMMSWAHMTRSMPEFLEDYAGKVDNIVAIATLGTAAGKIIGGMQKVTKPMRSVTKSVFKVTKTFTKPVATGLSYLNQMYSVSQQGFHLLSFIFSASVLFDMKDKNSTDAEFSKFGAISLFRHFTSYYAGLMNGIPLYGFVQGYSPGNNTDKAGLSRLAQVVNDSRDGFTKNRKCTLNPPVPPDIVVTLPKIELGIGSIGPMTTTLTPPSFGCYNKQADSALYNQQEGGWKANIYGFKFEFRAYFGVESLGTGSSLDGEFYYSIGIDRAGGSDLREEDNSYSWSGADTVGPDVDFGGKVEICGEVLFIIVCADTQFDIDVPTPPFGVGAALAGSVPDMNGIPHETEDRDVMYGRASENFLAWDLVIPPTPAIGWFPLPGGDAFNFMQSVKAQISEPTEPGRNINTSYQLRRYQDTTDKQAISTLADGGRDWISGLEAPYLLIGLIKDDVIKDSQMSTGVFELDAAETVHGSVFLGDTVPFGVIAKSEVYYTRPKDVGAKWFLRSDAREEKSNAFNPYWQARLVDTSYIDRTAALSLQHGQLELPPSAQAVIDQFKRLLERLL
jgi:hypothetical protein